MRLIKNLFIIFILLGLVFPVLGGQKNLLKNPGFEEVENGQVSHWQWQDEAQHSDEAYKGKKCVKLESKEVSWIGVEQLVEVDYKKASHITVKAFVKVKE